MNTGVVLQIFMCEYYTLFLMNTFDLYRNSHTAIATEAVEVLKDYPYPVLDAKISQRIAFAESLNIGSTVLETAPKSIAALEINTVVDELLHTLEANHVTEETI
jgi:chromosome partitioning protein